MAAKKKNEATYSEAADELDGILDEIETGSADIDVLAEKVERASELIRTCRDKLAATEMRVHKVVEELSTETGGGDASEG